MEVDEMNLKEEEITAEEAVKMLLTFGRIDYRRICNEPLLIKNGTFPEMHISFTLNKGIRIFPDVEIRGDLIILHIGFQEVKENITIEGEIWGDVKLIGHLPPTIKIGGKIKGDLQVFSMLETKIVINNNAVSGKIKLEKNVTRVGQ